MDKFKTKMKQPKTKAKVAALAALGMRRSSAPIPENRRGSNPVGVPVRYSSIPMNDVSSTTETELESSGNETDATETTDGGTSPPVQSAARDSTLRRGSNGRQGSVQVRRTSITKQTEQELEFMMLVTSGNVTEAREFLRNLPQTTQGFDVNRINFDGYSALHIAVHRQDEEMVKVLLSITDINIYDTFFYAIKEGDMGMVKQFIEFEFSRSDTARSSRRSSKRDQDMADQLLEVLERLQVYKDQTFNSEFSEDVTPLMLAAQCGHYELIKMFFDAGQRLAQIDDLDCQTPKCKSQGELMMSYARMHIYQAICNPAYICFMAMEFNTVDPILEAFNLISDLKKISTVEQEVKTDYAQLISDLQEFTGEMLGLCRDDTEVELLLKQKKGFVGNTREVYPRLILAVKTREHEFVTHPHSQKALHSEWIRGFESWKEMGPLQRGWELAYRTLLLPFISLWQFLYSSCWNCGMGCCKTWSSPVSRFIHSLGSYLVFLILLFLEANSEIYGEPFDPNDKAPPRSSRISFILEGCILVFAIGHIVATMKQFCFMPIMFFNQTWNLYEVLNHLFYIVAYAFFVKAWIDAPANVIHDAIGGREYWRPSDGCHPLIIGECFFSLGLIMSFGRIFRVLQLHPHFGPLQIALGLMLRGICKLMILLLTVIFSFSAGMCMLFKGYQTWINVDTENTITKQMQGYTTLRGATETLFWGLFAMSNMDNLEILTVHINKDGKGGGEMEENHHDITGLCAKMMFAVYHICAYVMMMNSIVAMLTGSIGTVFENVDKQYKMGRTEVYILYGRDMKVPAPFNTIALLRNTTFLRFIGLLTQGRKWKRGFSTDRCCYADCVDLESDRKLRTAYSVLVKDLLQRYFHAKATISMGEAAKLDQVNKVRETVGELREKFKTIYAGVTGVTPSRKGLAAVSRFKAGGNTRNLFAQDILDTLQPLHQGDGSSAVAVTTPLSNV